MIASISGKLTKRRHLGVTLDVGGICYDIMMPPVVMKGIDKALSADGSVTLVTYHYYQMDQTKAIPVLVGFLNEIEKEFFEQFITVSGVGPKAACKAMALPFSAIADAIDRGDMATLKTMPGIGEQKAREIIAKLQGKVGKFGLIRDSVSEGRDLPGDDIRVEAVNLLVQLQYKKSEAKDMVDAAVKKNPKVSTCEEILNEVYRGSKIRMTSG